MKQITKKEFNKLIDMIDTTIGGSGLDIEIVEEDFDDLEEENIVVLNHGCLEYNIELYDGITKAENYKELSKKFRLYYYQDRIESIEASEGYHDDVDWNYNIYDNDLTEEENFKNLIDFWNLQVKNVRDEKLIEHKLIIEMKDIGIEKWWYNIEKILETLMSTRKYIKS